MEDWKNGKMVHAKKAKRMAKDAKYLGQWKDGKMERWDCISLSAGYFQ
jgi:hypothetical protein